MKKKAKKQVKKTVKKNRKPIEKAKGVTGVSKSGGPEAKDRVYAHEVAVLPPMKSPVVTEREIVSYMDAFGIASQLDVNEKRQFVEVATAFGLNPFKREVYCVPYGKDDKRKLSIITGYEVYIKRAERSGKLSGWRAWTEGTGPAMKAFVEIHRRDWREPFRHEVLYSECVQTKYDGAPTSFWKRMPAFMLKKVCIAQGFRLAFPDELGGMPYTADELPDEMTQQRNVSPTPRETAPRRLGEPAGIVMSDDAEDEIAADKKEAESEIRGASTSEAVERVRKVVQAFSWRGKSAEYKWVKDKMAEGLTDDQADLIITHIQELGLPPLPPVQEKKVEEDMF